VSYILPSGNDLIKAYLHVDEGMVTCNNSPDLVSDAKTKKEYK